MGLKTNFLTNKRNILNNSLVIHIFLGLLLFLLTFISTSINTEKVGFFCGEGSNSVIPEITKNVVVEQKFYSEADKLQNINVKIATYARNNTSNLKFQVLDNTGTVVAENNVNCSDIIDNSDYNISFTPIKNSLNKWFSLKITSDAEEENGVTLYYNKLSEDGEDLKINDKIVSGELYMNGIGSIKQNIFQYSISVYRFIFIMFLGYIILIVSSKFKRKLGVQEKFLMMLLPSLIILFFSMPPILSYDSADYFSYIDILQGKVAWSSWNMNRSFAFPTYLLLGIKLFGNDAQGLLTQFFLLYFILILFILKIFEKLNLNPLNNKKNYILLVVLILINPLVLGIYHTILTEAVACTVIIVSSYLAWKWIYLDSNTRFKVFYVIYFSLMTVIMWHLKQPYVATVLFPLFIAVVLSIIEDTKIKNIAYRLGSILFCCIILVVSIFAWETTMFNLGVEHKNGANNSVSSDLIYDMTNFSQLYNINSVSYDEIINDNDLDKKDKEKISEMFINHTSEYENSSIMGVYAFDNTLIKKELFVKKDKYPSMKESLAFLLKQTVKHPLEILEGYTKNYLTISNIFDINVVEINNITVKRGSNTVNLFGDGHQNNDIFYRNIKVSEKNSNVLPMPSEMKENAMQFITEYNTPLFIQTFYKIFIKVISTPLFKISIVFLPILLILYVVKEIKLIKHRKNIIKEKEEYKKKNNLYLIFSFTGFFITLAHCILVMPIDRYAASCYIIVLVIFVSLRLNKNLAVKK